MDTSSEELRHWPWKVYAARDQHPDEPDRHELLIIHAPHRAAAKRRMWDHVDFDPDYIGGHIHNKLKEREAERQLQQVADFVDSAAALMLLVMLTLPLWYPALRVYELVTGAEVSP